MHWHLKIHPVGSNSGPARPQGFEAEGVAARRDVLCLCRGEPAVGFLARHIFKPWTINGTLLLETTQFAVAYVPVIQNESPGVFFRKCHVICSFASVESSPRLDVAVSRRASWCYPCLFCARWSLQGGLDRSWAQASDRESIRVAYFLLNALAHAYFREHSSKFSLVSSRRG